MKKLIIALITPLLLLTACNSTAVTPVEETLLPSLTDTSVSSSAKDSVTAQQSAEIVSEIKEPSSSESILGVIKTSNYFDGFYAYDKSYLIRSQEELDIFHEYMQETVFNTPIDFSAYSLAVEPLQSGSGSYKYECYSVDISENSIVLSFGYDNVSDGDAVTCDMAMYYPYALIPNELLTSNDYGRWTAPSQAEISIYKMSYVNGTADYDPSYFNSVKELGEKYGTGHLTFSVRFNNDTPSPELYIQMELCDENNAKQAVQELNEMSFKAAGFTDIVYPNSYRPDTPNESLTLNQSGNIDVFSDCADVADYDKMVEFFEAFEGETYDSFIREEDEKDITTMYYRRWHYDADSIDDITEIIDKFSDLPYEAADFNSTVTFMLSNE